MCSNFARLFHRFVSSAVAVVLRGSLSVVQSGGVPEPDAVFYGHVTRSPLNTAYVPTGVTRSLFGNAQTSIEDPTATTQ